MLPIKINRKFEIRKNLTKLVTAIHNYDWGGALLYLDRLRNDLVLHFLARPLKGGSNLEDQYRYIRYWLTANCLDDARAREALRHISQLVKDITVELSENPYEALRRVYDELRDDWGEFWSSGDSEGMVTLEGDLDELRGLEPKFAQGSKDVYKQFREILKATGEVCATLPMLSIGKLTDKAREELFNKMSNLFYKIETLMAPRGFTFEGLPKKEPQMP